MPPEGFKYRAFLSYSHHDRRVAEWLHRSIENYRIPKPLIGSAGRDGPIPERLFPVFRDRDELRTSPDLSLSLREALNQSANLIVVCSRAAAASRWVNEEIAYFKQIGRSDRIHALIVEGTPTDPASSPFPPALRFEVATDASINESRPEEPLAADLRPDADGKEDAKLKVIAGLLGVSFDTLRHREAIAARRRLRIAWAIVSAISVLAVAAAIAVWFVVQFRRETDEEQIPGLRVEEHTNTLDLTHWQETTDADLARREKKSLGVSTPRYTIFKTQEYALNYVHVIGTSSSIRPEVTCHGVVGQREDAGSGFHRLFHKWFDWLRRLLRISVAPCSIEERHPDAATRQDGQGRALHEFRVIWDISKVPLEERFAIDYTINFWNAFQTPEQWWGGFRVPHSTEVARFTIIFPPSKHPLADTIWYSYFDTKEHVLDVLPEPLLEKGADGRVARLTWDITSPNPDRSYRIHWDWREPPPPKPSASVASP